MDNVDGNLAALAAYERKQEANERAYNNFRESVIADGILTEYEELKGRYDRFAENYNTEISFTNFLGEEL